MSCSFPSLNWARLRVHVDGTADVFDMDGRHLPFTTQREAELHLLEDEYTSIDNLDPKDFAEIGLTRDTLKPPVAASDDALVMFVDRS